MFASMTESEFLKIPLRPRHKMAAKLLRTFYEERKPHDLSAYRRIEKWSQLPPVDENQFQSLADRYHLHMQQAELCWQEHNLLRPLSHQTDKPSEVPYLPIHIYLDNIRSAFNVGSIIRTTEAFRLGTLCFSKQTPYIDNVKVQKTSMCSYDKVPTLQHVPFEELPRPLISLETAPEAPSVLDFVFPQSFTLVLGNEEYGVSQEILKSSDAIVKIPLYGFKNSLNVASAYSIAAAIITHQLRKETPANLLLQKH